MATPENKTFLDELMRKSNEQYSSLTFTGSEDSWREAVVPEVPSIYKASYRYRASQYDAAITFEFNGTNVIMNTRLFNALKGHKEALEATLGVPLDWRDEDDDLKRRRTIQWDFKGYGYRHHQAQTYHHEALISAMMRLDKVLRPRLIAALESIQS